MGVFIRHEPCPNCGSRDNLGRYADGSAWCFGCKYREPPTHVARVKKEDKPIELDQDLSNNFPPHVVEWMGKYGITVAEAIRHGWKYGQARDQLLFVFKDADGNISLTQARNFSGQAKSRYFTQGSVDQTLSIFYPPVDTGQLVVVEDVISAAKIGRQVAAIPCFGSNMPKHKLSALRLLGFETLITWLDEDKLKESRAIADAAKWLGFNTKVVHTPLDPKEYSDHEIKSYLQEKTL
jgi:DNA primase